jgi:hypothetical protein
MARDPLIGAVMGMPQSKRRARRRYDLALNAQGVEMRLPSMPRINLGWRLVSFSLVALMAVLVYQFWEYPTYRVKNAEVSGLSRVSSSDVNAVLKISDDPIFNVDPLAMELELQDAFPEFSSVAAAVEWPNTVVISVTERIPVLVWRQDGRTELVDAEGLSFPLRDGASEMGLPVVEAEDSPPPSGAVLQALSPDLETDEDAGEIDADAQPQEANIKFPILDPDMVAAILTLAQEAPQGALIQYNSEHGFSWRDPGEFDVYFGDGQDMQMKLLVFEAIYKHLDAADTRPSTISVEYVHAPYYRLQP